MKMNMTSQNSTVIDIFTQKNTLNTTVHSGALPPKKRELNGLPLQVAQLSNPVAEKPSSTWLAVALVLLTHALVIYLLSTQKPLEKIQYNPVKPMMVSIIAPPSPEPEIVPIIEPPKPEPKPIVKPKKVVEKILPIEKPVERMVEATTEPPKEEEATKPEAAPVLAAEPAKAPEKAAPVIEDKYEEPRFGVAYLNNPAPEYPSLSRRQGEEGRVLMKVLVSANGAAEDVQIEKSSGSDRLDNAAVSAVKRWRFIPAKKNNQPLSAYVLVPIKFSLDN
jgi:periplasmic protein TonB